VKPPAKVKVGPHTYTVVVDRAAIDRLSAEGGEKRLGECDAQRLTITVDPDQAPSQLADTLVHELLHACFDLIGAGEDISNETEEKLVRRLSPVLVSMIKDNQRLASWITEN
jgi:hypothetical protein